jgi:hypothetical protein
MAERVGILSLFLNVAFYAAAERGIKLREIADLHWGVTTSPSASSARWPGCFGLVQMKRVCVPGTGECNCFLDACLRRLAFGVRRCSQDRRSQDIGNTVTVLVHVLILSSPN